MHLSLGNFLTQIKNIVTGGGNDSSGDPHADAGFVVERTIHSSLIAAAANTTAVGTFSFLLPRDYDEATDSFEVDVVAKSAGATDTPTLTLAPTADGTAMTASSGTLTSAALSNSAATATFTLNGNALVRDQLISLVLTSAAHTTDAVDLYTVRIRYRSTLVSYNDTDDNGADLR